jgi:outer membrane lipoprotein LolB
MRPVLLLAGAALAAAGCVRMEVVDDGLGFDRRQASLTAVTDWDLRGGIVVDTGDGAYQSRFSWQQRGDALTLEINGRLGVGRTLIVGNASSLTVDARGETQVLTDPERQLSEMIGWWLPVTSAEHWLLGRPDPDYSAESSRGAFDTLRTLNQRDWQISYDEYQIAEGHLVPRRITLSHDPLELSLRIVDWQSSVAAP